MKTMPINMSIFLPNTSPRATDTEEIPSASVNDPYLQHVQTCMTNNTLYNLKHPWWTMQNQQHCFLTSIMQQSNRSCTWKPCKNYPLQTMSQIQVMVAGHTSQSRNFHQILSFLSSNKSAKSATTDSINAIAKQPLGTPCSPHMWTIPNWWVHFSSDRLLFLMGRSGNHHYNHIIQNPKMVRLCHCYSWLSKHPTNWQHELLHITHGLECFNKVLLKAIQMSLVKGRNWKEFIITIHQNSHSTLHRTIGKVPTFLLMSRELHPKYWSFIKCL